MATATVPSLPITNRMHCHSKSSTRRRYHVPACTRHPQGINPNERGKYKKSLHLPTHVGDTARTALSAHTPRTYTAASPVPWRTRTVPLDTGWALRPHSTHSRGTASSPSESSRSRPWSSRRAQRAQGRWHPGGSTPIRSHTPLLWASLRPRGSSTPRCTIRCKRPWAGLVSRRIGPRGMPAAHHPRSRSPRGTWW